MRILLTCAALVTTSFALAQVPTVFAPEKFSYQTSASLDVKEVGVQHRGTVAIHDISYASPKGGRVPAYLVVPDGKGTFAAVIWGHWYWPNSAMRNRKEFLDEAVSGWQLAGTALVLAGVWVLSRKHLEADAA